MGTDKDPGVNIRSILELLRVCDERKNVDYSMCVSMVEVYNETVRDLLSENSSSQQLNVQMRNKQLVITDVAEVDVKSADDIKSIMQKGEDLCWSVPQFSFVIVIRFFWCQVWEFSLRACAINLRAMILFYEEVARKNYCNARV